LLSLSILFGLWISQLPSKQFFWLGASKVLKRLQLVISLAIFMILHLDMIRLPMLSFGF
jgi:hypothetical protein